jgi:hypothetical protein
MDGLASAKCPRTGSRRLFQHCGARPAAAADTRTCCALAKRTLRVPQSQSQAASVAAALAATQTHTHLLASSSFDARASSAVMRLSAEALVAVCRLDRLISSSSRARTCGCRTGTDTKRVWDRYEKGEVNHQALPPSGMKCVSAFHHVHFSSRTAGAALLLARLQWVTTGKASDKHLRRTRQTNPLHVHKPPQAATAAHLLPELVHVLPCLVLGRCRRLFCVRACLAPHCCQLRACC